MRIISLLAVLAVFLVAPVVAWADLDKGMEALERKDYDTAYKEFLSAAKQGDAVAHMRLGNLYSMGNGVPQDKVEAARWYKSAAELGNPVAHFNLSQMYEGGTGVSQDKAEALRWLHLGAEKGHPYSQFRLGEKYQRGEDVPQDYAEAVRWFRLAAEQEDINALFLLGESYKRGRGVPQGDAEAIHWYRLAAKQGHPTAKQRLKEMKVEDQENDEIDQDLAFFKFFANLGSSEAQYGLGLKYKRGEGVPRNYVEAARLFTLAAEQGHLMSQKMIGMMYFDGEGVTEDPAQGIYWFKRAANQGGSMAQGLLGDIYYTGDKGAPKNFIESYYWLNLSAAQGFKMSADSLKILERQMTREQIAEAQRLSSEFRPKKETTK